MDGFKFETPEGLPHNKPVYDNSKGLDDWKRRKLNFKEKFYFNIFKNF